MLRAFVLAFSLTAAPALADECQTFDLMRHELEMLISAASMAAGEIQLMTVRKQIKDGHDEYAKLIADQLRAAERLAFARLQTIKGSTGCP